MKNSQSNNRPGEGRLLLFPFLLTICVMLSLVSACSSPAKRFDDAAMSFGLQREVVKSAEFQHVVYWRNGGPNQTLHVYLDGDGTPELDERPSHDPTSRNLLILHLLAIDPGPAVYLGRPCYHGSTEPGCSNDLWTTARYSERVVSSLTAALSTVMIGRGYHWVSLFGHSGGGTLAMLLAERLPGVRSIVTIAANLDIDAWSDYHGQPRLAASLNPVNRPPLPPRIQQRHYVGSRDEVVPAALVATVLRPQNLGPAIIDGYDHVCCWVDRWPSILAEHATAE